MVDRVRSDVSLPHGTVTLLFSDIEGSTRLLRELGDDYPNVLADHRRALRKEFARHGGVDVDTEGDAFFVAFAKASDALSAAAAALDRSEPDTALRRFAEALEYACATASRR